MAAQAPMRLRREDDQSEAMKAPLTNRLIERLEPRGERYRVYDQTVGGLYVQVGVGGSRAFYYAARVDGRHRKLKLGDHPAMKVDTARKQVQRLIGEIAKGVDVFEQRRQQRHAVATMPTFKEAWERYRDEHLTPYCSPKTIKDDQYLLAAVTFSGRKLDTITIDDIRRVHERIVKRGKAAMANKVVRFLQRVYGFAIDEMGFSGDNPVRIRQGRRRRRSTTSNGITVNLAPERSRERYIEPREMPAFLRAIDAEPDPDLSDLVQLLLYTAARRGNVQAMKWAHLNLGNRATWTIPGEEAKSGVDITVPLSRYAVAVLKRRKELAADNAVYVFPAKRAASGHIEEPKKAWWAMRERAGIPDVTMHDIRRSVTSWATAAGVPDVVRKRMLGHAGGADVTDIYSRAGVEVVRDAFEKTTREMLRYRAVGKTLCGVTQKHKTKPKRKVRKGAKR